MGKCLLILVFLISGCASSTCEEGIDNYLATCDGVIGECRVYEGGGWECIEWYDRDDYLNTYCEESVICPDYFEEWIECMNSLDSRARCGDCWGPQWECSE